MIHGNSYLRMFTHCLEIKFWKIQEDYARFYFNLEALWRSRFFKSVILINVLGFVLELTEIVFRI
ncbi:hypothetical protein Fmac_011326 [Flemingia macrophylla]|uniref:Uncharacterized protein n=1 Tax=Flemingia macrophylla TaxID=520843 RepID=A0ABD1MM60_9FABA